MRMRTPRIRALEESQWGDEAKELLKPFLANGRVLNIFRTLANHPALARRWLVFANHILGKSSLAPRERELVILRIGYLCRAGYEWGQHVLIARQIGMTDEEIRSAQSGPAAPNLSRLDQLLLCATDELHRDAHIQDVTWNELSGLLSERQMMDLVFTVGQYNLVSMALNSFGVQPDEGLPGWDV